MRRPGQYGDSGGNTYGTAQMQHISNQRMEHKSGHLQGRPESLASEKDHSYGPSKAEGHWRWERDGQGGDASRSYYQGQRPDSRITLEKQGHGDPRSQLHEEDMDIGYEDCLSQTFEGLEEKFVGDIMKLSKQQTDAEDEENARHREKLNSINTQYEEQLVALRARHASQRDEFLRRESLGRQHQYKQAATDHYPNIDMGPSDPHGYGAGATPAGDPLRTYSADNYGDSYREQARFLGNTRDRGFEPRSQYPGGRVYDTNSRYY